MRESTATPGELKDYVLDTSVIIDDTEAAEKFEDNDVYIPVFSIGELDELKNERSSRGQAARKAGRLIDGYTEHGAANGGMKTEGGGRIFVTSNTGNLNKVKPRLPDSADGKIIGVAIYRHKEGNRPVVLVSKDFNMRSLARVHGLVAQDYISPRKVASIDDLSSGLAEFDLRDDDHELMRHIHQGQISATTVFKALGQEPDLHPNTCCIFRRTGGRREGVFYAIYKKRRGVFVHVPYEEPKPSQAKVFGGIRPMTWEQAFALHLARDPEISCMALRGPAGTGKTLMALSPGYDEVMKAGSGLYRQMVIYRPYVEAGEKMGAMPGPLTSKFAEFMVPITDNLAVIIDQNNGFHHKGCDRDEESQSENRRDRRRRQRELEKERRVSDELRDNINFLITEGPIEISPINFARGRSLNDTYVIADEAQNYNRRQAKLLATRAGKNAKVIFTGDHTQIDVPHLDEVTCGISHVVASMQGEEIFAHLTMNIAVRSELAEIAGRRM